MNAITGFSEQKSSKEIIISKLIGICNSNQITEYDREKHKNNKYWSDFIYIHDKKDDKVFVIKWLNYISFNDVKKVLNSKDFEVFCYSNTKTWTSYNSYKPIDWWVILIMKAKIDDILDLYKN